ncbi:MAG: hypothetical protein AAFV53_19025 [Myxococcota bacterium]
MRPLAVLLAVLCFPGCDLDPVSCDDFAATSVMLTLTNSDGAAIEGAAVSFVSDDLSDDCFENDPGSYVCGYEVEGDLTISAEAVGYQSQTTTVTVGADECHVITETAEMALAPVD